MSFWAGWERRTPLALDEPDRIGELVDLLLHRPTPTLGMWANEIVVASMLASSGDVAGALAATDGVRRRLALAGRHHLPDTLLPAAALAVRRGDLDRAARWLRAVREAGRPTQTFQVSVVYRRLCELVGPSTDPGAADKTLEDVDDEAIHWMRSLL